ncbi:MAG: DUF805 domain-containing protein [Gammaproteobacteria bacterium]|nr:DUF805 domain-containing protein [Gammaproteobacteria bacterium]
MSMMYCSACGKEIHESAVSCPDCGAVVNRQTERAQMSFGDAISTCLIRKYVDFNGRASRAEYWWFILFTMIVGFVMGFVDGFMIGLTGTFLYLSLIVNLGFFLPSLAAYVRRLHDTGYSGWWILLSFTIIGLIPLFIWLVSKGHDQANKYGDPV